MHEQYLSVCTNDVCMSYKSCAQWRPSRRLSSLQRLAEQGLWWRSVGPSSLAKDDPCVNTLILFCLVLSCLDVSRISCRDALELELWTSVVGPWAYFEPWTSDFELLLSSKLSASIFEVSTYKFELLNCGFKALISELWTSAFGLLSFHLCGSGFQLGNPILELPTFNFRIWSSNFNSVTF